jgi:hypothetical protein
MVTLLSLAAILGGPPPAGAQQASGVEGGPVISAGGGTLPVVGVGVAARIPLTDNWRVGLEAGRTWGVGVCEAAWPESYRCSAGPVELLVGVAASRTVGPVRAHLEGMSGVHRVDAEFGGTAPLLRLGTGLDLALGRLWTLVLVAHSGRALNGTWEDRLGDPPTSHRLGLGILRIW